MMRKLTQHSLSLKLQKLTKYQTLRNAKSLQNKVTSHGIRIDWDVDGLVLSEDNTKFDTYTG